MDSVHQDRYHYSVDFIVRIKKLLKKGWRITDIRLGKHSIPAVKHEVVSSVSMKKTKMEGDLFKFTETKQIFMDRKSIHFVLYAFCGNLPNGDDREGMSVEFSTENSSRILLTNAYIKDVTRLQED